MATKLNPDVPQSTAPDYSSYTRGANSGTNNSWGTLFKGIASVGAQAAHVADTAIQGSISREIQAAQQEAVGAPQEASQSAPPTAPSERLFQTVSNTEDLPLDIKSAGTQMKKLDAAYRQGSIPASYYWMRMDSAVSRLKTLYPGYSGDIDLLVKTATGHTPADQIAAERQKVIDQSVRDMRDEEKEFRNFFRRAGERGDLPPDAIARMGTPQEYTRAQIYQHVFDKRSAEDSLKRTKEAILEQKAEDAASKERYQSALYQDLTNIMANAIASGDLAKKWERVKELKDKGTLTPQEDMELATAFRALRTQVELLQEAKINEMWSDGKTSYGNKLDPEKVDKVRKATLRPLDIMEEAIKNKDYGIAAATHRMIDASKNAAAKNIIDSSDMFAQLAAAHQMGGNEMVAWAIKMRMPEFSRAMAKAFPGGADKKTDSNLTKSFLSGLLGGKPLAESLKEQNSSYNGNDPHERSQRAAANRQAIEERVGALTNPNVDYNTSREATKNIVMSLYGEGNTNFLSLFPPAKRMEMYQTLVTPEVTQKMMQLREPDPEAFDNYVRWAKESFQALFRSQAQSATTVGKQTNSDLSFDPKTAQFMMTDSNGRLISPESFSPKAGDLTKADPDYGAVLELNKAIRTILPVIKAEGKDPGEEIGKMLHTMGYDDKEAREFPFATKVRRAITAAFSEDGRAVAAWMSGPVRYEPSKDAGKPARGDANSDYIQTDDTGVPLAARDKEWDVGTKPLLDFIGNAESGGNYNDVFGAKRKLNISNMSINDVLELQGQMKKSGSASTAVGKYQFLNSTLKALMKRHGLTGDEVFSPDLQDSLAASLLDQRGYKDFREGKITDKEFGNRIAKEWAALPTHEGKSYYAGDGLNASTVKRDALIEAMRKKPWWERS